MLVGRLMAALLASLIHKELIVVSSKIYRWRKVTDVGREYSLFELLEGDTPLLDVGMNDDGVFEVAFNPAVAGRVMLLDEFVTLLGNGRFLAESDC